MIILMNQLKYKLVIFDFDGTIGDSFLWFRESINKAAKKYKFREINQEEIEILRGLKTPEIMNYLGVSWWKVPFIARYMRKLMTDDLTKITLFEGATSLINQLADQGINIVILSSNSFENVSRILGPLITARISHFECGVSIFGKKHRFKKIVKMFNLSNKDTVSIGDETRDIEAAREARIDSGAVTWGYATGKALEAESPQFIFNSMDDIVQTIIN